MPVTIDGTTGITSPAIDVATPVTTVDGGTGLSSFTSDGAVYATSTSALTTGTLPVASGGTGAATHTANNVLIGNGTSAITSVAPGTSGNVLTSNGTTWTSAAGGALTLLATITTTSGTSVNSGTVDLTSYKQVQIVLNAVSNSGTSGNLTMTDPNATAFNISGFSTNATQGITGILNINLATGIIAGTVNNGTSTTLPSVATSGGSNVPLNGKTTFSTASTIFTFGASAGAFDAGSILVYGVK